MNRADWLFEPLATPSAPVKGESAKFPVNRIFCVGRNYAAHAHEMGVEVDREAPFYFTKSAAAFVRSGAAAAYPPGTQNLHHEMELVLALGASAFQMSVKDAPSAIYGYACGLDMTRRDLQQAERKKQRPWDLGKDFEQSAVLGPITKAAEFGEIGAQRIWAAVNGEVKQDAALSDLIWSAPELISHLSHFYHLAPGDLIYTGTPAGVGPVGAGDVITGGVDGLEPISFTIAPAR